MMLNGLIARAERLALDAKRRTIDRLAAGLRSEVRGLSVAVESNAIVVEGRGLVKRWLSDPALRFLGRVQR